MIVPSASDIEYGQAIMRGFLARDDVRADPDERKRLLSLEIAKELERALGTRRLPEDL